MVNKKWLVGVDQFTMQRLVSISFFYLKNERWV